MAENNQNETVSKIVSLCKRRGIIFQNSEIYGGVQGFYDYGPVGSLMKMNWKNAWWMVRTTHKTKLSQINRREMM